MFTQRSKKRDAGYLLSIYLTCSFWLLPLVTSAAKVQKANDHVIVISIDAFLPQTYLSLEWAKTCPTLVEMRKAGSCAKKVIPAFPSLTYPGHASIVTGVWPDKHAISANSVFDPTRGDGRGFWYASDIKSETIWDAAHAADLNVASLSWPTSAGTDAIDWNIPEVWTSPGNNPASWLQKYSKPELLTLLEDKGCIVTNTFLADSDKHDTFVINAAEIIIKEQQPELLLLHFLAADKEMHHNGRNSKRLRTVMAQIDEYIQRLIEATKEAGHYDRTTFIVTGDHGFASIKNSLRPNVLLVQEGLMTVTNGRISSWKAMVHNTGGSAAVYLKDPSDKKLEKKVRKIFEKHSQDNKGDYSYRIVDDDKAAAAGAPKGPSFFLVTEPPNCFSGSYNGNAFMVSSVLKGNHGFWPERKDMSTGFIAFGPRIRKGIVVDEARLIDISPTVAKILRIPWKPTEGRVLTDILHRDKRS